MMDGNVTQLRTRLDALFKELGLKVGPEEADKVAGLHRHFAANRAKLTATDLGDTEPATVFSTDAAQPGHDDDRA